MSTIKKYINYISTNRKALKMNAIAKSIDMDVGDFSKAINGRNMANGKPQKIPARCLILLKEYFEKNQIVIK